MSDFSELSVICLVGMGGFLISYYILKVANEFYLKMLTGVIDGSAISPATRLFLLSQLWLTSVGTAVFFFAFMAFAELELAKAVEESGAKMVAYLGAFVAAVGSIGWLVTGINAFFYGRSLVRQAEAD